jgi:hypothetical protein
VRDHQQNLIRLNEEEGDEDNNMLDDKHMMSSISSPKNIEDASGVKK